MSEDTTFNELLNTSITVGEDAGTSLNHTYLHYLLLAMLKHLDIEVMEIQGEEHGPSVAAEQPHAQSCEALTLLAQELQRQNDNFDKDIKDTCSKWK